MAKRRKRRGGRRRPRLIILAALVLLAAGFITRRVLEPRAMRFLTHRSAPAAERRDGAVARVPAERLSDSDRRALDEVVRGRSR